MTIREVIQMVDTIKPNAFPVPQLMRWISALEGRIACEVFLIAPDEVETYHTYPRADLVYTAGSDPTDPSNYSGGGLDDTLLVRPPHDDLYSYWLQAQIDLANGEYDRAQNTMAIFNEFKTQFVCWFCQRYDPAQGYEVAL